MSYYYLVATLPSLTFGTPPELSFDAFRTLCAEHLSPGDTAVFDRAFGEDPDSCSHPFVARLRERDRQIRNATARARAARRSADATPFLREHTGYDVHTENAVGSAFAQGTPLQRETALDRLRWDAIEEFQGHDPFSMTALLAYGFRLRIAERWAAMDEETGTRTLDVLMKNLMDEPMAAVLGRET